MCFKPKSLLNVFIPDIYFNGEILTTLGKTKYLGTFIDFDAHDNANIRCARFINLVQPGSPRWAELSLDLQAGDDSG